MFQVDADAITKQRVVGGVPADLGALIATRQSLALNSKYVRQSRMETGRERERERERRGRTRSEEEELVESRPFGLLPN